MFSINHKIEGQDWITEISGQLILLNHSDLNKDTISTSKYTNQQLLSHQMGGDLNLLEGRIPTYFEGGKAYGGRRPNAQKVVDFMDTIYPVLNRPGEYVWGGDKLDGFLSEKLKATSINDPYPQLDSGGDISADFAMILRQLFRRLKDMSNTPRHDKSLWKPKDNFHIEITAGNDLYHQQGSVSRHTTGNACDFVLRANDNAISPINDGAIHLFDILLMKFMAANNGRFTFINEYKGYHPTDPGSGDHFHISWNPLGKVEPFARPLYQEAITKYPSFKWEGVGDKQEYVGSGDKNFVFTMPERESAD